MPKMTTAAGRLDSAVAALRRAAASSRLDSIRRGRRHLPAWRDRRPHCRLQDPRRGCRTSECRLQCRVSALATSRRASIRFGSPTTADGQARESRRNSCTGFSWPMPTISDPLLRQATTHTVLLDHLPSEGSEGPFSAPARRCAGRNFFSTGFSRYPLVFSHRGWRRLCSYYTPRRVRINKFYDTPREV